jgi:S1-C subfamily serine protease/cytochrome c-type biogenesis protein CcmH/NrfG
MGMSRLKRTAIGAGGALVLAGGGFWLAHATLTHGPRSASANVGGVNAVSTRGLTTEFGAAPADELFTSRSPAVVRVIARGSNFSVMQGSGFFISRDGLLVTNYHVIRGAEFASVLRDDNTTFFVEGIAAEDKDSDLALLKVNVTDVPFLRVGADELPKVGTKVYAIGNPEGLTNTLSEGLVSGLRTRSNQRVAIQTSAAISHGSSGGPLLSADGLVVGVTSAMAVDGQNLNFAVPASQVRQLIRQRGELQKLATAGAAPLDASQAQAFAAVWSAIDQRKYAAASRLLSSMRSVQKDNPVYWMASGFLHNELNNASLAIDSFKSALRIDSSLEPAWFGLGEALRRARRYAEAIDAFKSAAKLKPHDARAYIGAGYAAGDMKDIDRSIEFFEKAEEYSPENPEPYAYGGILYLQRKQFDHAIESCQKAVSLKPDYAYGYLCLGMAYECAGRHGDAIAAWQNAIRFDPFSPAAKAARGLLAKHE